MLLYALQELKAGDITESKLRMIEGVHKSMVKDLFLSMDEDGGGVLDVTELRLLSMTLGYRLTDKELAAAMAEMDEDGSGEVGKCATTNYGAPLYTLNVRMAILLVTLHKYLDPTTHWIR